jgi:uncharacterized protein
MNCPRCSSQLTQMTNKSINLDVCYNNCGGIWFDSHEFKKMDETHEASEDFIVKLSQSSRKSIPLQEKIQCPKCASQPMLRRFSSIKKNIEIDECPSCAGIWLDAGEITQIHSEFKTEQERTKATEQFIQDTFGGTMAAAKLESEEKVRQAQKVAKALRFICPSFYIPGKQKGGAF